MTDSNDNDEAQEQQNHHQQQGNNIVELLAELELLNNDGGNTTTPLPPPAATRTLQQSDSAPGIAANAAVDDILKCANYFASYDAFKTLCINNAEYFRTDDSENGQRFYCAYIGLLDHLESVRAIVDQIKQFAHEYDFDENTPGNGYRSFLLVVQYCINHGLKLSSHVMQCRGSLLFRKSLYMKEVESCCHLLASLYTCLQHLLTLHEWSEPGSLFPTGVHTATELFATADSINQYCFYGRCLGIQYCDSMQSVLKFLAICMAGFSEAYYKEGTTFSKTTSSMWTSGKYYWNPELRARRIVNISQNADIEFCKSFWSLAESELMHTLPSVIGTAITINKVIDIPSEPLELPSQINNNKTESKMIKIPIPMSHIGCGSISARLMSYRRLEGMIGERGRSFKPQKTALIFHCHGGGFVAQSSKSHEIYLRDWAVALDIPILSIDYSLAPDAPFPRAIEEVFYAYCWAIKNSSILGTTAERIILAGDSAGANLNLALAIKCIEVNIRKPDGIFLAYCPVRISFDPSPARLLCLMDPLLPFGFMMRCLKAYACPSKAVNDRNKELCDKKNSIRYANQRKIQVKSNESVSSPEMLLKNSDTESDMPTFVNILSEKVTDGSLGDEDDNIDGGNGSIDGNSSLWEHIEMDFALNERKSPGLDSDRTSDTYASASLHSQTVGNTEMITPDESNGISFEEDSQPITIHKPINNILFGISNGGGGGGGGSGYSEDDSGRQTYQANDSDLIRIAKSDTLRSVSAANALEFDEGTATTVTEMAASTSSIASPSNESEKYVEEFVQRYVLDTDSGIDKPILRPVSKSEENLLLDQGKEMISVQMLQNKFCQVVGNVTNSVSNKINALTASTPIRECKEFTNVRNRFDSLIPMSPSEEFDFDIPRDPLLSPFWASDDILAQLPKTHILTVDMDPCLDDCVMFAKRLQSLQKNVSLDILPGLPHGFLNFVKLSKEAYEGNKICINRLKELLNPNESSTN